MARLPRKVLSYYDRICERETPMIAVLTFKCKREVQQVSLPEGLRVLPLVEYSALEHTLNILEQMNITKLLIMTDGHKDAFENHSAYRKAQEKYTCSVMEVEPDFNWHSKAFFDAVQQTSEDVVWLCGDMFIYRDTLHRLCSGGKSSYVELYSSSNIKQHDPNLRYADYLKSYASIYQNGGTNADTIPAAYFRASDWNTLVKLSQTLEDGLSIMHLPQSKKNLKTLNFYFTVLSQPACLAVLLGAVESEDALAQMIFHIMVLQQTRISGRREYMQLERHLTNMDAAAILYIRNSHVDPDMQSFHKLLHDSPTVILDAQQPSVCADTLLKEHFAEAAPKVIVACGDARVCACAEEVRRSLLARFPAKQPLYIRIPTAASVMVPLDFSWISSAEDALVTAYLKSAWNTRNLVAILELEPQTRIRLYAFILANCLNILFSKNEEQSIREFAKVILYRFFSASASPEQIMAMAMEANIMASLCGRTVINTFADCLSKESGVSQEEALLFAISSVNLFTAKNIKKDFANIPRKVLTDNLDDMLISAGFSSAPELFASTLAMLRLGGQIPTSAQIAAAAAAVPKMLTDQEAENSLFVPDSKTLRNLSAQVSDTAASHMPFLTELWDAQTSTLGQFPTPAKIRKLKDSMAQQVLVSKYRALEADLFHGFHTLCQDHDIGYRILRCSADEGNPGAEPPYLAVMMPWELERLSTLIADGASQDLAITGNCNPEPNIFADAYLYKKGTVRENRWNLGAVSEHKEVGIPILSAVPAGFFSGLRLKLANAFSRVICQRSGYYVPTMTKAQKLLKLICRFISTQTLKKFRSRLLQRPAESYKAWSKPAYLDLHHEAVVSMAAKAADTCRLFDRECPVIYAPDHVFSPADRGVNTFYEPIRTAYRIHFSNADTHALQTPNITASARPGLILRAAGKLWKLLKTAVKWTISGIREAFRAAQEAMKPVKAKLNLVWKLLSGVLRGMGICLSAQSRAVKKYRNKYAGQRCFLIGNGPSLRAEDLDALEKMGEITFACNFIHRIYPSTIWRPTYHFISDSGTVRTACWDIVRNVADKTTMVIRDFAFDKMPIKPARYIVPYSISQDNYKVSRNFLAHHYISHATVMTMMLEAAMYMGFKEIYLVGVDATTSSDKGGNFAANYFTPEQRAKLDIIKRKAIKNYDVHARRREIAQRQQNAYEMIARAAEKRNIKIYNATRGGALEAYERVDLDEIIGNA